MYFLMSIVAAVVSSLIALLPVFLLVHVTYYRKIRRSAPCFLLALYFAGIYYVTGLPTVQFTVFEPEFYLLPIIGIAGDLRNSILNVILFVPLGFLVPLFCNRFQSFRSVLKLGLGCSLFIELAQMFTYRLSDINDLITNALGALLGYRLAGVVLKKKASSVCLQSRDILLSAVTAVVAMYFLRPLLGSWVWRLIG